MSPERTRKKSDADIHPDDEATAATPPPDAAPTVNGAEGGGNATADAEATTDGATLKRQADEYLEALKRERADFANYRRRMDEDRAQLTTLASLGLTLKLLSVLDDFERAASQARPEELETAWAKGVQLIERNLRSVLVSEGVERLEAQGAVFDPHQHEALGQQPSADVAEGHVLHVVRPGYRKGDRVIRPAQVIVSSGG